MVLSGLFLRILVALLMLNSFPSQTSMQEPRSAPPPISVVVDSGVVLLYDVGLNIWNGAVFDRTPTDAFFYTRQAGASIPFVPLGDTIRITFECDPPDGWTLYDRIDGTRRGEQILDIGFIGNTAAFTLEAFPEDLTHDLSAKHGEPPDLRTFILVCGWSDNVCEYAFGFSTNQFCSTIEQ